MGLPPVLAGGEKKMINVWLPAVMPPMIGAPGATADMEKLCTIGDAAKKSALPDCVAEILQVPAFVNVTIAPETLQTAAVVEPNVSGSDDDADAAVIVMGEEFTDCAAIAPKVMVWLRFATIRLKLCVAFGRLPLAAVMVIG